MRTILEDYCAELVHAVNMKKQGLTTVPANVAGTDSEITIEEYISRWLNGICAMATGAPEEDFNY